MSLKSFLLSGLLCLSCVASARSQEAADPSVLTLDRIISRHDFAADGFGPARWLNDGSGYTTLEPAEAGGGRDLVKYDPATGRREILVAASSLKPDGKNSPLGIDDYAWSDDGGSLLIFTNTRRVWRLNTRGDYWAFHLKSNRLQKIGGDVPPASLLFAKFSPDATRVGYVRENNIFVQDLADGKITSLTGDGSPTRINGTFDWVYEEEFFLRDGFRWSPDGKSIAYWQIDTTGMSDYVLVNTTDQLYPKLTTIRYPKVGRQPAAKRAGWRSRATPGTTTSPGWSGPPARPTWSSSTSIGSRIAMR